MVIYAAHGFTNIKAGSSNTIPIADPGLYVKMENYSNVQGISFGT